MLRCSDVKWLHLSDFILPVGLGFENSILGHLRTPRQGLCPKSQHAKTSEMTKKRHLHQEVDHSFIK